MGWAYAPYCATPRIAAPSSTCPTRASIWRVPGIALYGYHPAGPDVDQRGLRPALTLRTRLARVEAAPAGAGVSYNHTFHTARPSLLGLVPRGYADGLPRTLSNKGHMLVGGNSAALSWGACAWTRRCST